VLAVLECLDEQVPSDIHDLAVHGHDAAGRADLRDGEGSQLAPAKPAVGGGVRSPSARPALRVTSKVPSRSGQSTRRPRIPAAWGNPSPRVASADLLAGRLPGHWNLR
jgi:hypothetical protein